MHPNFHTYVLCTTVSIILSHVSILCIELAYLFHIRILIYPCLPYRTSTKLTMWKSGCVYGANLNKFCSPVSGWIGTPTPWSRIWSPCRVLYHTRIMSGFSYASAFRFTKTVALYLPSSEMGCRGVSKARVPGRKCRADGAHTLWKTAMCPFLCSVAPWCLTRGSSVISVALLLSLFLLLTSIQKQGSPLRRRHAVTHAVSSEHTFLSPSLLDLIRLAFWNECPF